MPKPLMQTGTVFRNRSMLTGNGVAGPEYTRLLSQQPIPKPNHTGLMENLIRQYIDAYNKMDVPAMVALLHDVIVFENVSNTQGITVTSGKADFDAIARQSLPLFRSRRQTIRSITLGERTAAVEIVYEAIPAIDLPTGLKAGETMQLRGVTVFAFSDGKIARISDYS